MADSVAHVAPAAPAERLSLGTKLAYGAGDTSTGAAALIVGFFQALFLTTVAGLNPGAAGLIVFLSRVWDAVTDPWMGVISDRTRSRLGRRRFWILIGAVPFGLIYALLWWVPPLGDTARFFYYLVVILAFNTVYTVVNVPYTSLTAELTSDYDGRTALTSYRFAFSIGGSVIAGVLHGALITRYCADPTRCLPVESQQGYLVAGVIFGVLMILPFLWCVAGTRERYVAPTDSPPLGIGRHLVIAARNRPFLFVIGIYLCSWFALQLTQNLIGFYLTFYLRRADMFPVVLLAVQGSAMVFLFVWSALSRRIGKQAVYYAGMSVWIMVMAGLFFLQPHQITLAIVLAAVAGSGIATAYLVPWSMLPDVVDLDELHTGRRREGIFYGIMTFTQKTCIGLGIALTLQTLEWFGFSRDLLPGDQPASALLALRWLIGPVPTVMLILGMLLVWRYPLTRQRHAAILRELEQRRAV